MKKFFLFVLVNLLVINQLKGQLEVMGSQEYGRIFEVTYDPTTPNQLFAITLSNHIVRSQDNGQTWEIFYGIPNSHFSQMVKTLKMHGEHLLSFTASSTSMPNSRSVFLLNTETKTIEKQYTPPHPDPNAAQNWVNSYDISKSDPNYAIISVGYKIGLSNYEKIYYTKNGGQNWTMIYYTVDNFNIFSGEVALNPANPSKIYISRGHGDTEIDGGLLISEDEGQTWTEKLAGIILDPISFHPENPNEVWVGGGIGSGVSIENLYKSTDGGNTWNIVPINWTSYILDCITRIEFNPQNPSHILVLEENEVAVSEDGGNTWNVVVYPSAYDNPESYSYGLKASFNPYNENEVFISANYYPMFSTDKGQSMVRIKTPYFSSLGNLHYVTGENEEHLYYGVQNGFVHQNELTHEEESYNILPIHFVTTNSATTIIPDRNKIGRIYSYSGGFMGYNLQVSDDHGSTQTPIFNAFLNTLNALTPTPENENIILAGFSFNNDSPELYRIDFTEIDNVQVEALNLPNATGFITGILFPTSDSNTVLMAFGSRVYKSNDGGNTWNLSSNGLEALNLNADVILKMVKNPLNSSQISIGTSKGIFTSIDGGENWTQISSFVTHNLAHSTLVNGHILAATHDSDASNFKISFTSNGGENWTQIPNENLIHINSSHVFSSTDFQFFDDYAYVYVATPDLGIVRHLIDLETLEVIDSDFMNSELAIIYPNPTKDSFQIKSKNKIEKVEVYSLTGQHLLNSSSHQVNVSNLNPGIYIVNIRFKNGQIISKKLIRI